MDTTYTGRSCVVSYYRQIKKGIDSVAPKLFNDPNMTVLATWKVFKESIFDTAQRKNVETFTDFSVRVVKVMKEFNSTAPRALVPGAGGLIQGEIRFIVEKGKAPDGYTNRDLLIAEGVTYAIDELTEVLQDFVLIDVKGLG